VRKLRIDDETQKEKENNKLIAEKGASHKVVLKQKYAQIVDLITKSNGRLHNKSEEAKKKLSEMYVILQAARKENEDAKKVIQQFRQNLVSFENQIQENVKTQLSAKEK